MNDLSFLHTFLMHISGQERQGPIGLEHHDFLPDHLEHHVKAEIIRPRSKTSLAKSVKFRRKVVL